MSILPDCPTSNSNSLLNNEERLRLIEQNVKDYALFTLDAQGRIASWNLGAERILRYEEGEIIGQSAAALFTPEDRQAQAMEAEMKTAQAAGRAEEERWHLRKDGSRFWASSILTALRDEAGGLRGYAKILRDVTERKQEQERAVQILESITDAFFALDAEWRFTYMNIQAEALLLRSREELLGKSVWEIFLQAANSTFHNACRHAAAEQTTVTFEEFYPPLDAWFSVRAYPSREGLAVYFQNISARKAEEARQRRFVSHSAFAGEVGAALSRNETLTQCLQTCAEAMVGHLDAAFARVWTLNAATNMLELQASAGLYTHLDGPHSRVPVGQFKIGLIAAERKAHLTNAVIGDPLVGDQDWARREGMSSFAGYPLVVADQVVGVMAMFSREPIVGDTLNSLALVADALAQTIERKRAEARIHTLNARLKRLVTETHHRVKNNLQVINAMIEMQVYSGVEAVPLSELTRISSQIRALSSLHDILTLSSKDEDIVEFLPVKPMLEKLLPMLQSASNGQKISHTLDAARLTIQKATSLSLLVNELVSNACKHGNEQIEVSFINNGETATLIVEDDGPGFPAEFDPARAANTGLELIDAFARHDLGGAAQYGNRAEGGGRVRVTFPLFS